MEWVETTAKTVDEARSAALDQLGVAADEAEFDVVEEPRPGLFGRLRGEARVRARVKPAPVRPKQDRRRRSRSTRRSDGADQDDRGDTAASGADDAKPSGRGDGGGSTGDRGGRRGGERTSTVGAAPDGSGSDESGSAAGPDTSAGTTTDATTDTSAGTTTDATTDTSAGTTTDATGPGADQKNQRGGRSRPSGAARQEQSMNHDDHPESAVTPEEVGAAAVSFMEGLAEAFGQTATTSLQVDGIELDVSVEGDELGLLIGPGGRTLTAIQDLARVASQRRLGDHDTRLRIDVAGYRERRQAALTRFAREVAESVRSTGTARSLEPMTSADRKVIHDVLNEEDGVTSRSEGDDPDRRIVVEPA
jgi:spoIIIJ-associated protein